MEAHSSPMEPKYKLVFIFHSIDGETRSGMSGKDLPGGYLLAAINETWSCRKSKASRSVDIRNKIGVNSFCRQKLTSLLLHARCYAMEYNRLLESIEGCTFEQAAAMALAYTPTAVNSFLADPSELGTLFPMKFGALHSHPSSDGSEAVEVPVYEDIFLDVFKNTAIHESMVVSNFVTLETNQLRLFCCQMVEQETPEDLITYCEKVRGRTSQLLTSLEGGSLHTQSVLGMFKTMEVERAEMYSRYLSEVKSASIRDVAQSG